jgi:hypothetical protein
MSCEVNEQGGILILNEGTFGNNEARLDYANQGEDSLACVGIFSAVNNQMLGDVGQEMLKLDKHLYILVNNSHLIYKLNFPSLRLSRSLQLPGGNRSTPRSIVQVDANRLYVSSLLDSGLYVVDKEYLQVRRKIFLGNYPEGLVIADGKAFVCLGNYVGTATPQVAVVDTRVDSLIDLIQLPLANPGAIVAHAGHIWVACRGEFLATQKNAGLVKISIQNHSISETIPLQGNLQNEMQVGASHLFVLRDSSIARLALDQGKLEENWVRREDLTTSDFEYPYSLSLDKFNGRLYVGIANGLGANGRLVVLNPFGQVLSTLPAGRFPGQVVFWD